MLLSTTTRGTMSGPVNGVGSTRFERERSDDRKTAAIQRNIAREVRSIAESQGTDQISSEMLQQATGTVQARIGRTLLPTQIPDPSALPTVTDATRFIGRSIAPRINPTPRTFSMAEHARKMRYEDALDAIQRFGFESFMASPMARDFTDDDIGDIAVYAKMNNRPFPMPNQVRAIAPIPR